MALGGVGCATTGYERSNEIAGEMARQAEGIQKARPQVDAMLASLDELTRTQGDMRPVFMKFIETLDATEKAAASARKSGQTIREKEAEYLAEWQKQAAEIVNPEIKAASQTRQAEVKTTLGDLSEQGRVVGEAYDPFISDMRDIRTYLSNDLTTGGMKSLQPTIEKARRDGATLQKALDEFNRASERVQTTLRPTGG
jgi:Protein of unknown function (DUF2959)